jgi:hypothetical protein
LAFKKKKCPLLFLEKIIRGSEIFNRETNAPLVQTLLIPYLLGQTNLVL